MKSRALRGTLIMLAAVALIGAVVALRVAQAQTPRYTISVTPDKVLEQDSSVADVQITVKITVEPPFASGTHQADRTVYLHIANDENGVRCDIISASQCVNAASIDGDGSNRDFSSTVLKNVMFEANTSTHMVDIDIIPRQDVMIEGDEKIYLALCTTNSRNCSGSSLLETASITIVGEKVWADNIKNSNTSTVALKGDQPIAASFTTGSDPNGYRMNNVKLKFGMNTSEDQTSNTPTAVSVRLFRDATLTPGVPGALIGELTQLGNELPTAESEIIYTETEGRLLKPNSTYWVRVSGTAGFLETTGNRGQNGWAIQDGFLMDTDVSADGIEWMSTTTQSLKMEVSGIPRGNIVVEPAALSVEENRESTYTVRLDSPPLTETTVNVMSEDRSIATISPGSITFKPSYCPGGTSHDGGQCWWDPYEVTVKGGFVSGEPKIKITHEAKEDHIKKSGFRDVNLTVREVVVFGPVLSNLDAENATSSHDLSDTSTIAQPFRTGNRGYKLTHVQVEFEVDEDPATLATNAEVKICSMQNGKPNLGDCTTYPHDEKPFDDVHTYELVGGKDISAGTNYYVVVDRPDEAGMTENVRLTKDVSETASLGWILGDNHVTKGSDETEWMTIPRSVVKLKLIGRTGDEIPTPTPAPTATVTPTPTTPTPTPTATALATDATATAQAATATAQAATATALATTATAQANATATAQANATATAQAGTPTVTPTPTATAAPVAGVTPSGLRVATRTQTTATISWIPGRDATGHAALARSSDGDMKFALDLDGAARSYTFTGMKQKVYTYYLIAKDSSGSFRASDGSYYRVSVTGSGPPPLDVAPSGLRVVRSGTTAIITWTPGADAAGQILAAMIAGDRSSLQVVSNVGATASSHAFSGLKQGVYTYHVLAFDTYGNYSAPDGTFYYAWVTEQ